MLQFDLQFYEELTVAWVRTVKFISGAFFWLTGQLVIIMYGGGSAVILSLTTDVFLYTMLIAFRELLLG